jgi:G:T/U-mismatch repair DNA glycosylase
MNLSMEKDFRNPCSHWKGEPFIPDDCRVVLMGTITTEEGISNGYYYSAKNNHFWEILDGALHQVGCNSSFADLKAKLMDSKNAKEDIRKEFHDTYEKLPGKMAVCDILESCSFCPANSSSDDDIINGTETYNWPKPLAACKNLKFIVANSWKVIRYCRKAKLIPWGTKFNSATKSYHCNNGIEVCYVPSPSNRCTRPLGEKIADWSKTLSYIISNL